jgi:hypothetical protein
MDNNKSYLPPNIAKDIDRYVQPSMPYYLREHTGSSQPGPITPGAEVALSQEIQRDLPDHLKRYADAYVSQQYAQPRNNRPNFTPSHPVTPPPLPNTLRKDHAISGGQQHTVELNTLPLASKTLFDNPSGRASVPENILQASDQQPPVDSSGHHHNYEFIMSPNQSDSKSRGGLPQLPGLNNNISRIAVGIVGLVLLIVVISLGKSVLSGSSNYTNLLAVLQDQNEIVHISSEATSQPDISATNQTFVSTVNLVLANASTQLNTYLVANHHKISPVEADFKQSATLDQSITNAESSGTFNQFFEQTASTQLDTYIADLNSAYKLTSGPNGRDLLKNDYSQALLLKKVLDADSSTSAPT